MKEKASLEKQGSLALRMLLIISMVLVVIVLAGGFIMIKRMMNQPEPQTRPVVARAKVPSPPPAPEPTEIIDKDPEEVDQKTTSGLKTEAAMDSDSSDGTEPPISKSPEVTLAELAEVVAEKKTPQTETADQKTPMPADDKAEKPSLPNATKEPHEPEDRLSMQQAAPEPEKALPGQGETKPTASVENKKGTPSSLPESQIRKGLAIQVASYRTKAFAEARTNELNKKGYKAFIHQVTDKNKQPWYVVRLGHFENRREADTFLLKFNKEENAAAIVIHQK